MPTYKLTLEYDGTAYAGWQRQPDQPSIQAAFEAALFRLTQRKVDVIAAGRTDAGVHALGQVVSFRCEVAWTPADWVRALNAVLPSDIAVLGADLAADEFHARYAAKGKHYRYRILNRPPRSPFERQRAWHVWGPVDLEAMRTASRALLGSHDWSSFEGPRSEADNRLCTVSRLDLSTDGPVILLDIEADRFLKQMVRAVVGTLVEVGQGKRPPTSLKAVLDARDRRAAGFTAPPHGLYLVRVWY